MPELEPKAQRGDKSRTEDKKREPIPASSWTLDS
jgi:hypothetical protein